MREGRAFLLLAGYNRQEAARLFKAMLDEDDSDAFAHWGVAYCHGADYNMFGPAYDMLKQTSAWPSYETALAHAQRAYDLSTTDKDGDWKVAYDALLVRFTTQDLKRYADALDALGDTTDPDLVAVHAEAHMLLSPWNLWDRDSMKPNTVGKRVLDILERGLELTKFKHEWLCHLCVHACEMGPKSQFEMRALPALEESDMGHLRHMPTHLYIQLGDYAKSVRLNREAVEIDARDRKQSVSGLHLYSFYECHNMHFVVFAACMGGMRAIALEYATKLSAFVRDRIAEHGRDSISFVMCEAYLMVEPMTMVRFGMWKEILEVEDESDFPTQRMFLCYAKSIACAALNRVKEAREHQVEFLAQLAVFPDDHRLHNETVVNIALVSKHVIEAEILYRIASSEWTIELTNARQLEASLAYDEPPAYMIPVRQTTGALLSEAGRHIESVAYFSEDLQTWPKNAWSLAGLNSALAKVQPIVKQQYTDASRHMDIPVTAACACATKEFGKKQQKPDQTPVLLVLGAIAVALLARR